MPPPEIPAAGKLAACAFAIDQLQVEADPKKAVARWVTEKFPLRDGAGVVLDAGSTPLKVWEALRAQLGQKRFAHIRVLTSNYFVLNDWVTNRLEETPVDMDLLGTTFDWQHRAFYLQGPVNIQSFRPAVVYVGVSGFECDHGLLLGWHGNDLEKRSKEFLFQIPCKRRVILTTSVKIGDAGGNVFDILSVENLDTRAPIYLVTTQPRPGSPEEEAFCMTRDTFMGLETQELVRKRGLEFHWVTIDTADVDESGLPRTVEDIAAPVKIENPADEFARPSL